MNRLLIDNNIIGEKEIKFLGDIESGLVVDTDNRIWVIRSARAGFQFISSVGSEDGNLIVGKARPVFENNYLQPTAFTRVKFVDHREFRKELNKLGILYDKKKSKKSKKAKRPKKGKTRSYYPEPS